MRRADKFLMLVQTGALSYDLKFGGQNCPAIWVVYAAMNVDPRCLPNNLEDAAWGLVDYLIKGQERPPWLRYKQPSLWQRIIGAIRMEPIETIDVQLQPHHEKEEIVREAIERDDSTAGGKKGGE